MHSFTARIERPDGVGWHYVDIPFDSAAAFGSKGPVKVRGTCNGVSFRSTLLASGHGRHILVVGKELREEAQVDTGDLVQFSLEPDDAPREVLLHPELAAALLENAEAGRRFERLAYSHRKRYNDQIVQAQRDETRARRIAAVLDTLLKS